MGKNVLASGHESNGDGGAGERRSGGGLITSGMSCGRENCQGRQLKTDFN